MFLVRVFASGAIASQASGALMALTVRRRPVGAMCRGYRKPRMASGPSLVASPLLAVMKHPPTAAGQGFRACPAAYSYER